MIKSTTDLIKALPFKTDFKEDLLKSFDSLDEDKRFNIERILWDTYCALYDLKLQENLSIAFEEASRNQEKLDKDFYKRVNDLTEQEMNALTAEDIKATDLDMTREKLQDLISPQK